MSTSSIMALTPPFWEGLMPDTFVVDPSGTYPQSYLTLEDAVTASGGTGQRIYCYGTSVNTGTISVSSGVYNIVLRDATISGPNSLNFMEISGTASVSFYSSGRGKLTGFSADCIEISGGNLWIYPGVFVDVLAGGGTAIEITGTSAQIYIDNGRIGESCSRALLATSQPSSTPFIVNSAFKGSISAVEGASSWVNNGIVLCTTRGPIVNATLHSSNVAVI